MHTLDHFSHHLAAFALATLLCGTAQAHHILPAINHGDIAINLLPVATGPNGTIGANSPGTRPA